MKRIGDIRDGDGAGAADSGVRIISEVLRRVYAVHVLAGLLESEELSPDDGAVEFFGDDRHGYLGISIEVFFRLPHEKIAENKSPMIIRFN